MRRYFIICARASLILALLVVVLGAYVRLSHAGLGCPDWPGCYGEMIVSDKINETAHLYPERPFESDKAWKEMVHRYAAGLLGLLIFIMAVLSWRKRNETGISPVIPTVLAVLVLLQALLGMWTVTLLLKPVVVMAHLLGGMTILALLFWMNLRLGRPRDSARRRNDWLPWAIAGIGIVAFQISLGGWTSANYSALVCPDLPTCQGSWWPDMDFTEGFTLWRGLGVDYEGGVLSADARTAIHMSHRIGAIVTILVIGFLAGRLLLDHEKRLRLLGVVLTVVLMTQVILGLSNVLLRLPLVIAVAHHGMAAILLLTLVVLLHIAISENSSRRLT